jgi:integrase
MLKLVAQSPICDELKVPLKTAPKVERAAGRNQAPGRKSDKEVGRQVSWISDHDVKKLRAAVKTNRHADRDSLMILMAYRHGLRASELVDLQWSQVLFRDGMLSITRKKNGKPSLQSLERDEILLLKKLHNQRTSQFIFESDRGDKTKKGPMRREAFNQLLKKASTDAGFELSVNPHALRHACGHGLAVQKMPTRNIQDYLGHKNIRHTERYTDLATDAFKRFGDILKG